MAGFRPRDLVAYLQGVSLQRLLPFLEWRHLISRQTLRSDIYAGLTGATIVLPQARLS